MHQYISIKYFNILNLFKYKGGFIMNIFDFLDFNEGYFENNRLERDTGFNT